MQVDNYSRQEWRTPPGCPKKGSLRLQAKLIRDAEPQFTSGGLNGCCSNQVGLLRVNRLYGVGETSENTPTPPSDELTKKQKTIVTQTNVGSVVAASGSPCRAQ
jgi:hypothetical protein